MAAPPRHSSIPAWKAAPAATAHSSANGPMPRASSAWKRPPRSAAQPKRPSRLSTETRPTRRSSRATTRGRRKAYAAQIRIGSRSGLSSATCTISLAETWLKHCCACSSMLLRSAWLLTTTSVTSCQQRRRGGGARQKPKWGSRGTACHRGAGCRARRALAKPALDVGALVAVAVDANDGVPHHAQADRAGEGWRSAAAQTGPLWGWAGSPRRAISGSVGLSGSVGRAAGGAACW